MMTTVVIHVEDLELLGIQKYSILWDALGV